MSHDEFQRLRLIHNDVADASAPSLADLQRSRIPQPLLPAAYMAAFCFAACAVILAVAALIHTY